MKVKELRDLLYSAQKMKMSIDELRDLLFSLKNQDAVIEFEKLRAIIEK